MLVEARVFRQAASLRLSVFLILENQSEGYSHSLAPCPGAPPLHRHPPGSPMQVAAARCLAVVALLLCSGIIGCASTRVPSLAQSGGQLLNDEDEQRIIRQSDDYERELRAKGLVLEDPALQRYVDTIGQKLVPPAAAERVRFHFAVVRDPTINAFSLPQGGIYVHIGLLARLENEAQLAHVLGHEITHTVNRHQLAFVRDLQNKTVAAKLAQIVLAPAASVFAGAGGANLASSIIGLTYAASVTGYGRQNEEEADREGLKLIAAAGYRIQEAPRLFTVLNEMQDPGALEVFFYSTHPANESRQRYTQQLVDSGAIPVAPPGVVNVEAYQPATWAIVQENIRLRLQRGHYQYALDEATAALARRGDEAWLYYYVGEGHRHIASDPEGAAREDAMRRRSTADRSLIDSFKARTAGEQAAALAAYKRALALDKSVSVAHRGIGLIAYQQGDKDTARRELQEYANSQAIADRRYIEKILREVTP